MNRINEMIRLQEYKNVKRVKLKDCCSAIFSGGTPLTSKEQFYDGNIPWIRSGEIDFNRIFRSERNISQEGLENSSAKLIRPKSVVMAMTGATVAKVATIEAEMAANQSVCALELNCLLDYRFLYFYLATKYLQLRNSAQGALTSLNLERIKNIEIPLPPLNIQKEIVSILDSFTSLIDKMKQEVEMRKKQMVYYIDKFYGGDFDGMMRLADIPGNSVAQFSDLGPIIRGKRFVRDDIRTVGQPCIHYGDMYTYYGTMAVTTKTFLERDFPKKMRYAHKGDVVIVGAGENDYDIGVGLVWMGEEPAAVHDACYILKHHQIPMYISYYLRSNIYHQQLKKYVSSGKISSFSAEGLGKVYIPIQPEDKQRQIASILDTFETYISKLEKMIELRQKQYEYYREKLLKFE